jgi:hypothetical protein
LATGCGVHSEDGEARRPCLRRKRKPGAADRNFSAVTGERLRPVSHLRAADLNRAHTWMTAKER